MKITIDNNEVVYIYLKNREIKKQVETTIAYAPCRLLYDHNNKWSGIEIGYFDEKVEIKFDQLLAYDFVDENIPKASVEYLEDCVRILFKEDVKIELSKPQDCSIDVIGSDIVGIEIQLWEKNKLDDGCLPAGIQKL